MTAIGGDSGVGGIGNNTKNLEINGGILTLGLSTRNTIECQNIIILGGTIIARSSQKSGVVCRENGTISLTGGNILVRGNNNLNIATYSGSSLVPYTPKSGENNLYETPIKLNGVAEGKKITSLTTSDSINYGTKDMYTLDDGMLYLYLPLGSRTINIQTEDGNEYSGTVETKEIAEVVTLNEMN